MKSTTKERIIKASIFVTVLSGMGAMIFPPVAFGMMAAFIPFLVIN